MNRPCRVRTKAGPCGKPVHGKRFMCYEHSKEYLRGKDRVNRALAALRAKAPHLADFLTR